MAQNALPFKYEEEKKDFGVTGKAGLLLFAEFLQKIDFSHMVARHVRAKAGKDGWSDSRLLQSLMLLNICGGDCVDDIRVLEKDSGLTRLFRNFEFRGLWGRRRRNLKRQWRNGRKNAVPSPSAIFRYLSLFHNASAERERQPHKAFIPSPNEHLKGLSLVNKEMLEVLQLNRPRSTATIDMDATLVESHKQEALFCYKGFKSYQPMNCWWWEQDYVAYTEFRDGNVPAGQEQKRVFIETLKCLPPGVEHVYLRSDSAGYQHDLMRYCACGVNERFGQIPFAIACDITPEFKKEIFRVEAEEWRPIYKLIKGVVQESGQEWAETCFVPSAIGYSKKDPEYRYIAIREKLKQKELSEITETIKESQSELPFPNMKIGADRYKLSGIVTNLKWYGEGIIHWHRERCGNSEHVHHEMKESFAGGTLPSKKFGANAAWWWIMVLSLNLVALHKLLIFEDDWRRKKIKAIRYRLINVPGRVVMKSKELSVRIGRGHPSFELLVSARRRISLLGALSPG